MICNSTRPNEQNVAPRVHLLPLVLFFGAHILHGADDRSRFFPSSRVLNACVTVSDGPTFGHPKVRKILPPLPS